MQRESERLRRQRLRTRIGASSKATLSPDAVLSLLSQIRTDLDVLRLQNRNQVPLGTVERWLLEMHQMIARDR